MLCEFKDREAFIDKYLRKELTDSERYLFEKHFTECDKCFSELEAAQQMMELVQEEGQELFPEHAGRKDTGETPQAGFLSGLNRILPLKWNLRPSLAYTLAAVVIVILGLYLLTPSPENNKNFTGNEQITGSDEKISPQTDDNTNAPDQPEDEIGNQKAELYAANFVKSEDLEYLMNQQVRSRDDIIVVSPETGYQVAERVLFKWESVPGVQVHLKILNNAEDVLFNFSMTESELIFNLAENSLEPGLYYWKLEKDKQLVHLGKFVYKGK